MPNTPHPSPMSLQKPRRLRGVILSSQGWKKLQDARRDSEIQSNSGTRYTIDELSERTGLAPRTVAKVLEREQGVDKQTLECFFSAFNLQLDKSHYSKPALVQESESASATLNEAITYTRQDLREAVDVSIFYNRTEELTQLGHWILQERCRLVALLGMGGIGKTSLSVKLVEQIRHQFEYVIWKSLQDAPDVKTILADLLQFLSNQETKTDLPDVSSRISQLLKYLHKHRCLVVLDNAESILCSGSRVGHYRDGYEEYGELFRRVGEVAHSSCLVLTSREKPKEIALLEGEALPVRVLQLSGLDVAAGQEIFKDKGCFCSTESESRMLIEHYAGNPLALKMVAATIQELFDGNVSELMEYFRQRTLVFEDIRDLLARQFERLSELEKEVMYWLAINREPVSISELQLDILSPASKKLPEALKSLGRRSLIERSVALFSLQPAVMEYVTERLIEQFCEEILTQNLVFFKSNSLLKTQAKDYVRDTQIRLILNPVINELLTAFKSKISIENQLAQIIAMLRETSPLEPGYTGGNICNLLLQLGTDLSKYDFSYLTVWQADLQRANLQGVNFAHADLSKSVFAETFGGYVSVAFSPDGQLFATGDTDYKTCLWQVVDGKKLLTYKGDNTGWIWSVAFSTDGQILASGGSDGTVYLWQTSTGRCLKTLPGHARRVGAIAFHPNGQTLASSSDDHIVRLWDISTGQCLKMCQGHTNWIRSIAFSPDGHTIASSGIDQTVRLWDTSTGQCCQIFREHTGAVWSVTFSANGQTLVSGSGDHTVRLWDIATGHCLTTLQGHNNEVMAVTFGSQGKTLYSGAQDETIKVWDVKTGSCLRTLQGYSKKVWSIALSPEGHAIASGSEDQALRLWEVDKGQCLRNLRGYSNRVWGVAFNRDGQIATGSEDSLVRLWDVNTGRCVRTLQGHTNCVSSVAFSPNGQTLVSASEDSSVRLWDINTGQCLKKWQILTNHSDYLWSLALSPDGRSLASEAEHTVKIWDISTGECLTTLQGHTDRVRCIAYSPVSVSLPSGVGQTLVTGSDDLTVKLWNINTGQCLRTMKGHTSWLLSVAFSPDGQTLASSGVDSMINLWNAHTGECLKTLQGHTNYIRSVAFSPDSQILASSGGLDQTIRLWDVRTGNCLNLQGHTAWILSVAFSPQGEVLVSGSHDGTVKIWDTNTGECLKTLRSERPYEGMNITGVTGLTEATIATLKALGAVEYYPQRTLPVDLTPVSLNYRQC